MMKRFKHTRRTAVTAALGVVLAFGGAGSAAAQTGSDIGSTKPRAMATTTVIGPSFVRWTKAPIVLPANDPAYSQINFMRDTNPADSEWTFTTSQIGQAHASATVLLKKTSAGGPAEVSCDLRMTGLPIRC